MPESSGSSDKQVAANRVNSTKSSGPRNTNSTRFNATKHGLLSAGITELDDADGYRQMICRLDEAYAPEIKAFLREQIALQIVRLRRIARLEAEYITSILNPAVFGEVPNDPLKELLARFPARPLVDPGLPASITGESVGVLVSTFQRYESSIENKLYRAMNQFERLHRIEQGEHLPAPVAVDVAVHSDHRNVGTDLEPPKMVLKDRNPSLRENESGKIA